MIDEGMVKMRPLFGSKHVIRFRVFNPDPVQRQRMGEKMVSFVRDGDLPPRSLKERFSQWLGAGEPPAARDDFYGRVDEKGQRVFLAVYDHDDEVVKNRVLDFLTRLGIQRSGIFSAELGPPATQKTAINTADDFARIRAEIDVECSRQDLPKDES